MELITKLQNFMFLTNERFLAAQHSPGNLIVVEDKEEDSDDEGSEGSDRDDYFPLPVTCSILMGADQVSESRMRGFECWTSHVVERVRLPVVRGSNKM